MAPCQSVREKKQRGHNAAPVEAVVSFTVAVSYLYDNTRYTQP